MSLITCEDLEVSFGERVLFRGVNLQVRPGSKIGLLGRNGSGKSTLFKLLSKQMDPDAGAVRYAKTARLGHVSQDVVMPLEETPRAYVMAQAETRVRVETAIADAEAKLQASVDAGDNDGLMEASEALAELHETLAEEERVFGEPQAIAVLKGLGLSETQLAQPLGELSGGWRLRVALAGALFRRPDVLLLDEPTNHLDLPSVLWLMDYLSRYPAAVILTSHDAGFIDEVTDRLWLLRRGDIIDFQGSRAGLARKLEEAELNVERTQAKLEARSQEIDAFVKRFRAQASKAAQVQSRIKELEKIDAQRQDAVLDVPAPRFSLPAPTPSGRTQLTLENLHIGYEERAIVKGVSAVIRRGDKIAVVGANGAGKSTLLKALAAELSPMGGTLELGSRAECRYISQHLESTHEDALNLFEWAYQRAQELSESRIRGILAGLGFDYEAQKKSLSVLSGGERARLAFSALHLRPGNLLLIDEPTNHLDLEACESLIEALQSYEGTVVVVSHHQALLERVPTSLWVVESQQVLPFPGDYARYRATISEQGASIASKHTAMAKAPAVNGALQALESQVTELEGKQAAFARELDQEDLSSGRREVVERKLAETKQALSAAMDAWAEAQEGA